MKGTIDAGEGGTLFLTIPYDEGWTVTVDGKEAITRPVWKAFTGVELKAGTHTVELRYYPRDCMRDCCSAEVRCLCWR